MFTFLYFWLLAVGLSRLSSIIGIFIGEVRPREYTREDCLCVQVSEGTMAYIRRDDISYIMVSETGFVTEEVKIEGLLFAE